MSEKVTAPAELRDKLAKANGESVTLCDDAGNVIGYAYTPEQAARLAPKPEDLWTPEEIARIIERSRNDARPKRTMAEVLRLVEGS